MKKILSIVFVVLMSLLFVACPPEETEDGNITVAFTDLIADGSQTALTTRLTLTFDRDITGLSADDIDFEPGDTGAVKGTLTRAGAGYRLSVSGITKTGTVSVGVSKTDYTITPSERQTTVYFPISYTITFDTGGGAPVPENQLVAHGETAARPDSPRKDGEIFAGWFREDTFVTRWDFTKDTVTGSIILYARYMDAGDLAAITAQDYIEAENLTVGWNLGNSLDAPGSETAWRNPLINQAIMDGVKAAGFNLIRIPVTWSSGSNMGSAPNYTINEAYLQRVAEVVGYAEKAGLTAMINLHHEGWLNRNNFLNAARDQDTAYATLTDRFTKVWEQIAEYFKDHDLSLMFQSMNEIHDGNWGSLSSMGATAQQQLELINTLNQIFTDVVRASGGNNATRFLILCGYAQKPHLYEEDMFTLPEDTIPGKQIVSFHYYEPYPFAHDGTNSFWGSAIDKARFATDFRVFRDRFTSNNIPVFITETGPIVYGGANTSAVAEAHQNRLDYITHMFGAAKEHGLVPVYWDNGQASRHEFQIFNRNTGAPYDEASRECIEAMIDATR